MKEFDSDIVSGSILRSVWKLTWPVTLLNLVNGMHGLVDHILVGWYDETASNAGNAAIGMAWQVFLVIVVFIASLFHGMNVLIARYAGKQDRESMSRVAYQTFLTSLWILLFLLAPIGYLIAPWLLKDVVGAAPEVFELALPYLRIMFTCGGPMFLMFLVVGAFQASGDPKTPLLLGILATVLNVSISAVLITGFGPFPELGVAGAALGTVLATTVSVTLAIVLILSKKMILQPPPVFNVIPDFTVIRMVARIGLPTGIQGVLLNVGGVTLMIFINKLEFHSAAALAAYTICYNQLFSLITWTSFGLRSASATVMGQNIGAGDPKRGKSAVQIAAAMGFIWALCIGSLYWFIPHQLLALFSATAEPLNSFGTSLLHFLAFSGIVLAPTLALTGGIQGAGETKLPMYIAFATQIVLLLGMCGVFYALGMLEPRLIWLSIFCSHFARLVLTWMVFRTDKWTLTQVEMGKSAG